MSWSIVATIGGSVIGGLISSDASSSASNKAADAQKYGSDQANAAALYQYNQTREDNAPWRAAGEQALNQLTTLMNSGKLSTGVSSQDVYNDPGYQFAASEGQRAINNSASARGGIGGAALRAGSKFAENNANQFYGAAFDRNRANQGDIFNRLSSIAGTPQQINGLTATAGQNYANTVGNNAIGMGNVNAANSINQGNIYGNAVNQLTAVGNRANWWQTPQVPLASYYQNPGSFANTNPSSLYAQNGSDVGFDVTGGGG